MRSVARENRQKKRCVVLRCAAQRCEAYRGGDKVPKETLRCVALRCEAPHCGVLCSAAWRRQIAK